VSGPNGTTISWASSAFFIEPSGIVHRPYFDEATNVVTLTATISKGAENDIATFDLTVIRYSKMKMKALRVD
jgi:hypothetical protein